MTKEKCFDSVQVFGEVLFDVFPDQKRVLGGAPFNVACHLKGFGLDPLFMSRVGNDDLGKEAVRAMDSWSLCLCGLQLDKVRPTGTVRIRFKDDEPSYDIKDNVAYDYIAWEMPNLPGSRGAGLIYHGTLAARNQVSAQSLYKMIQSNGSCVFCDINLRDPWWSTKLVRDILSWCSYLKVNEDELRVVADVSGIGGSSDIRKTARALQLKHNLKCLIVTLGSQGAGLYPAGEDDYFSEAPEVSGFQDSVGAGDAFSSVFLLGLVEAWPWEQILARAVYFAARICQVKGAVPKDRSLYRSIRQKWEQEHA
ncbi:carbohydrate kinase family protein [Desulfonatronovibrio hydrogenovorans]|uniref:carbohydrate kinase family protein n=1 Tax=Desulfonatronovibrio hydrogenovorans TaxID=53245 RepID=UPI00054D1ECA|nr:carbohydrate kinase [Desulfonatronovibrio hydrogenovorans]